MSYNTQQVHALTLVCLGVIEAVEAAGVQGAPAGILYAGMHAQGATFAQFQDVMATLVRPGYLAIEQDSYVSTAETQHIKANLTHTLTVFAR